MQTTLKSGWITDLVLPGPSGVQSPADVLEAGRQVAVEMCSDPIFMARLNPLVQKVEEISAAHKNAVDHLAMARDFKVDLDGTGLRGSGTSGTGVDGRAASAASNRSDILSEADGGDWRHYAITDKLTPFPGYTTDLTYYSAIRKTRTGMEALTNPGSGVTIYGRFSIRVAEPSDVKALDASDGKGWVVNFLETNELRCNVMLSYYIKATTDKSHRIAHGRFKELWRERMKERGFLFD
jgi:hypothetical protein